MAFNKADYYGDSLGILESQVGLVQKTATAKQSMATTTDEGKKVIAAGTLFDDTTDTYAEVTDPTADSYEAVTPAGTENPTTEGWYEKSGSTYSLSDDTTVGENVTSYKLVPGDNPKTEGWYTKSGSTYTATTDTSVDGTKTYYKKTRTASGIVGVVFQDYDMTDYPQGYPISVVVQGRLKADRVASEVTAKKSDLAAQGLYLISY